jgi:hypothetical protein
MDSVGVVNDADMFRCLHQMAMMSLSQQTQQHTLFYYHYCNSWAGSEMVLGLLLLEVLQQGCNEDNGKAGNFYTVFIIVLKDRLIL